MNTQRSRPVDILIAGAGFAGLSLAIALRQALGASFKVVVADPALERGGSDPRASAIVAAARRLFETIGVWERDRGGRAADPRHGGHRQPPRRRDAADLPDLRRRGRAGRAVRAHDRERSAARGAAGEGEGGWRRADRQRGRRFRRSGRPHRRSDCRTARRSARGCWSPPTARARRSASAPASRPTAGTTASRASSPPCGTSATTTAAPRSTSCRPGRSRSCRSSATPPATARRSSGPNRRGEAERIVALDDAGFHAELERRFGLHLGEIEAVGPRRAFPLGLVGRARLRGGARRAGRRRRARDPSDRGAGAQHGPQGRRRAGGDDRRCGAARARSGLAGDARPLPALAPLRHHGDGRRHRRA